MAAPARLAAVGLALVVAGASGLAVEAAITERIVADRHSGLAIDGFDPVAYFVDGEPREGRPDHEQRYGGAIWRFRNEGNRAAFAADPQIYAPCFGGYDPTGVARGVARPGHPLLYTITTEGLCFFHSELARAQFIADSQTVMAAADARWPRLAATLAR